MNDTVLTPRECTTKKTSDYQYVTERESNARTYAKWMNTSMESAYLCEMTDTNGKTYLDCLACAGTLATGHNHPVVVEAIRDYLSSGGLLQALDMTTPVKREFIERLFEILPPAFSDNARIQFCGASGADAAEAALKLFKTATGRTGVFSFQGAYHGMTAGALALTGNLGAKGGVGPLMAGVHHLPYPYEFRCPWGTEGRQTAELALAHLRSLLADPESGVEKPAAIICETIQGEGGVIPASVEWLKGLRQITADHDVPLIIDEIQTGIGRTGFNFSFERAGIVPDAILISKAVGGGMPVSMVVYHKRYDVWQPGSHAGTFRGNQLAFAAGIATLNVVRDQSILTKVRKQGHWIAQRLSDLAERHSVVGDVRGMGLMWGIELIDPQVTNTLGQPGSAGELASQVKRECFKAGLIIESGGRHGSVLRFLPPLIITDEQLVQAFDTVDRVLEEITRSE